MNKLFTAFDAWGSDILNSIDASSVADRIFKVILILILTKIALSLGYKIIDKIIESEKAKDAEPAKRKFGISRPVKIDEKRYDTVKMVSKNIYRVLLMFIAFLTILGYFIDVKSILAVAGIGGIAIGFGAQSLVEDIVNGVFIFMEDHYAVDEYISIDKYNGIVEDIGLRTTKIRDFNGDLHIIHNRKIAEITNHSRGDMRALVDIPVAYEENLERCMEILERLCGEIAEGNESIIEGPVVMGVQALESSSVSIRVSAKTLPMEQWNVERLMRLRIKEEFDREGIEIPYDKKVIYNR
ncbi:MAG: mechanosensitive ion channel family protein [Eubacteriaceae bacterium]|nr:mechanosensitive ion channel family protein [Eubacteriaceae bacterium]